MYLGNDEILEMYLGDDSISEAYLGEDLVFSSGPFMGLKVIPRSIGFNPYSLSGTTKVKSSEPWQITSNPLWITASPTTGDSGETIVTLVSDELSAVTSGSVMFESNSYSASLETSFEMVQFVDAVRMSTAPNWNQYNALNTHIPVGDTGATIRVKYWGTGNFSDRIVGTYPLSPDADDYGINDEQDFRYFPSMADAGEGRIDYMYGWDNDGQYYDITFGNLFVYDNIGQTMVADNGPQQGVDTRTSIRIDMSVNWIAEVIITNSNLVVADFKAAKLGNDYGMYDTVSNTFIHDSNLNIVPRTAPTPPTPPTPTGSTRTLEITDIPLPLNENTTSTVLADDTEHYLTFILNSDGTYTIEMTDMGGTPITGFTTSYTNDTLTAAGDWEDDVHITFDYYDDENCLEVPIDTYEADADFSTASTASLTFPTLEVNGECQCGKEGGDWDGDNEICLHDAALIIDGVDIPDDGGTHEYRILDSDGNTVSVLSIDTSDWSYTYEDNPDGTISHDIATLNVDDYGDLSAGGFRWELTGFFYGEYDIQLDNTSLTSSMPDFDGSSVANYISWDATEGDYVINTYSCYDEWNCMANDCGNWNSQTGECDCL